MSNSRLPLETWELLNKRFSRERLSVYLNAASGIESNAYNLFLWNSKIAAAFWELIGHSEIAIRKTVDSQLTKSYPDSDWLFSTSVFAEDDPIWKVIQLAKHRSGIASEKLSHHQLVQQLPLGFLQAILSKRYLRLWPSLASGFEGGNRGSLTELSQLMQEFRAFRNHVGHHDLLVNLDLPKTYENLLRVAELTDPEFKVWLSQVTEVEELLASKPLLG